MKKQYNLRGFYTITFWGGGTGFKHINIITDEEGLKKIRKEPLQDYISFGVESVDYVSFEVYLTEIKEEEDKTIKTEYLEPVERIEAGKYKLSSKEEEALFEDLEIAKINY